MQSLHIRSTRCDSEEQQKEIEMAAQKRNKAFEMESTVKDGKRKIFHCATRG